MSPELPQIVPQSRCLACDVCCRFPEAESPLRPYFTSDEVESAIAYGISPQAFPDRQGGRIRLIRHPKSEGYVCPAFDVETNRCGIYAVRPLDCRLYPFAVMRAPLGNEVLLGWDQKCPYLRQESDRRLPLAVSDGISRTLTAGRKESVLSKDPGLIGFFDEDVWTVEPLLTIQTEPPVPMSPPDSRLAELTLKDFPRLQGTLDGAGPAELSAGSAAALLMWSPRIRFWWGELDGGIGVVAEQGGGFFLPIPPFGGDLAVAASSAIALLESVNSNRSVSRIEKVSESQRPLLAAAGFSFRREGEEYLYDRKAVAELSGADYKSQRWNVNQVIRRYGPRYEPYKLTDLQDCLRLFARWRAAKEEKRNDPYASLLMADSFYAHWTALAKAGPWNLTARILRVRGELAGYTVGTALGDDSFLILHEVTNPDYPGLGDFIFHEFCREMEPFRWVNTMDDSGLAGLRRLKQAYRPARQVPFYTASLER